MQFQGVKLQMNENTEQKYQITRIAKSPAFTGRHPELGSPSDSKASRVKGQGSEISCILPMYHKVLSTRKMCYQCLFCVQQNCGVM